MVDAKPKHRKGHEGKKADRPPRMDRTLYETELYRLQAELAGKRIEQSTTALRALEVRRAEGR